MIAAELRRAIEVFCRPAHAARMLQLADSPSPRAHAKLRNLLPHSITEASFRSHLVTAIPKSSDARDTVLALAHRLHIADACTVLSENRAIDGQRMAFTELFDLVDGSGWGTFAVLDAEQLAFFQGEAPHSTLVLHQPLP